MVKYIKYLIIALSIFIFTGCAYDTYVPNENVSVIMTYGTPYYSNGVIRYYIYNGYCYYPYYYNRHVYYYRYNSSLPPSRHDFQHSNPSVNHRHYGNGNSHNRNNPPRNNGNRIFGNGARHFGGRR